MIHRNRVTVRFNDIEELALTATASELGIVDRNGKAKLSTFIRKAILSNQTYKKKLKLLNNKLGEPRNV